MLTTLNISNQEIKLVGVQGKKVKCWTTYKLENGIVQDGRVLDPQGLAEIIVRLFKTQKLPRNKVVATLSGLPYTYRIIDFPILKEDQVEEAIMRTLPDEFTIPVEDLYVSWAKLITRLESADYFVLGVDRDLVDSFIQTMKLAEIKDWSIDLKPLALARAVSATDAIVASLDLDHMDIILVRDGYIKELHATGLDYEGQFDFSEYTDKFVSEIMKILSYHHDDSGSPEPEKALNELPILVTGELIGPAGSEYGVPDESQVTARLTKLSGHTVSLIQPMIAGPATFNVNAYATNIGLFLKTRNRKAKNGNGADHYHDVNIDILTGKFEKKPVMVPMWYTVAPVVVFLLVFGAWSFNSAHSENSELIESMRTEVKELNAARIERQEKIAQQTKLEQQLEDAENTLRQVQVQHQNLLSGKGETTVYIADVRSNLPDQATLKTIRIGNDGVRISGNVASPFDVVTYIRSLELTGYDTKLHEIGTSEGKFTFDITLKAIPAEEE